MDLRGLLTKGGGATARGRTKEERKEAYKKPGRATSSTVSRTLRTIQVTVSILPGPQLSSELTVRNFKCLEKKALE